MYFLKVYELYFCRTYANVLMTLNTIDIDKTNESEFDEVADYKDERFVMFSPTNVNNRLILRSYWP